MSKLYTEEEVRKLLNEILMLSSSVDDAINSLTPIELPTDEEIDTYVESTGYYGHCTTEYREGIEEGAKWMRNKIKGGNNETH
jgi:hypothetical protein